MSYRWDDGKNEWEKWRDDLQILYAKQHQEPHWGCCQVFVDMRRVPPTSVMILILLGCPVLPPRRLLRLRLGAKATRSIVCPMRDRPDILFGVCLSIVCSLNSFLYPRSTGESFVRRDTIWCFLTGASHLCAEPGDIFSFVLLWLSPCLHNWNPHTTKQQIFAAYSHPRWTGCRVLQLSLSPARVVCSRSTRSWSSRINIM